MSDMKGWFYKLSLAATVFGLVTISSGSTYGQAPPTQPAAWVDDWTHHHLVYSNPGTEADAVKNHRYGQWYDVTHDPRYQMQKLKRSRAQRTADLTTAVAPTDFMSRLAAAMTARPTPVPKPKGKPIKKDWSSGLDGADETGTITVGSLNSTTISGSSMLTVGSVTLDANAPTTASQTGSFAGNPTNGQTVTIGGSEVLTASVSTAATGSITVASSPCIGPGQGVTINGTTLTTNATVGTGTLVVNTVPSSGETVVIGGVTYTFETTLSGTTPLNQVLIPGSNNSSNRTITAENLSVAINNSGTCGSTSGGVCTRNLSAANSVVSSTDNPSSTQTLTARCGDNATITGTSDGSKVTVGSVGAASSAGINTTTTFALNTSGSTTTPASQTVTAANIIATVNLNATTSAIVTATSGGTGIVSLTADTWGTIGDYAVTDSATGLTSTSLSGGVNGTNTTTFFAIDNVNDAANLASAITRNGSTVGVSAASAGSVVTVTATTAGSSGNSISLADGLSNFTWAGSTLASGADGTTNGSQFAYWSGNNYVPPSQLAINIATAINDNTTLEGSGGVTATSSGNVVTLTSRNTGTTSIALSDSSFSALTLSSGFSGGATGTGTVQPNTYPAKYGVSLTGASCADFVIYPTGRAGSSSAATIVAYDNIYTAGCSGAVPSVYWAYNTGGTVTTSPVISYDGSQVAFMQVSGTTASLVLLKWAASTSETLGAPLTLITQSSASNYRSCTGPCMYTITLSGSPNDTLSAPFYDYVRDALYVGDDSGNLHQFFGVFNGNPAESGSPWPVHLGTKQLSSPVYDSEYGFQGGYVFVGDMGGVFYSVGTGYGGTTNGLVSGNTGSLGDAIADAPLVNSGDGTVFVFVTTDGSTKPYPGDNGVFQLVSSFTNYGSPGVVYAGTGGTGYYFYAGDFDNVYYDSGNPASGNLYVVGNTAVKGGATLYQLPIAYSSFTGASNAIATGFNSTENPFPSPLTEFCNNGVNPCSLSQRTATGSLSTTSPNVTLTSGTFTGADLGAQIWASPSGILYGKVITSVLSSTTADLEFGVFANETGQTFTIQDGLTTSGTDYLFFSVNRGIGSGCTNLAGNGCILAYNVSNAFHAATGKTTSGSKSVTSTSGIAATDVGGTIVGVGIPAGDTITAYSSGTATLAFAATATSTSSEPLTITPLLTPAGSGLNVITPGTNGCWATGGLIIDNSDTTTSGASQIYFINLNGVAAGGPTGSTKTSANCTTGAGSSIQAVQASQASP